MARTWSGFFLLVFLHASYKNIIKAPSIFLCLWFAQRNCQLKLQSLSKNVFLISFSAKQSVLVANSIGVCQLRKWPVLLKSSNVWRICNFFLLKFVYGPNIWISVCNYRSDFFHTNNEFNKLSWDIFCSFRVFFCTKTKMQSSGVNGIKN